MKTKQLIFTNKEIIKSGMTNGRKWTLYKYIDEEGMDFTSFHEDYPLNEPQEIEYEEKEVPSRDGTRTFTNRMLIEPKIEPKIELKTGQRMAKRESDTGEKIVDLLGEILIEIKALRAKTG